MRRGLALAALVALAVLAWWQLDRAHEAPNRAPRRQGDALPDDVRRSAQHEGGPEEQPPASRPEQPRLLLEGRVVHADGRPAEGAEVSTGWAGSVIRGGGPLAEGLERFAWRTTTGADGRFRFFATRTRPTLPTHLDVRARLQDRVAMPAALEERRAPYGMGDLVLEEGLVVRAHVRNSAGAPIGGAQGFLAVFRDGVTEHRRLAATSDAQGDLVFFPLRKSAKWSLRLTVSHPSYPEMETRLDLADQRAGKIAEVVLPLGVQVRGRITDPEGRPRTGVCAVAATCQEESLEAQWNLQAVTDAQGEFVVNGIPAGEACLLLYPEKHGRVSSFNTLRELPWISDPFTGTNGGVIDLGTFVMHAPGAVRGRVVDAAGTPLETVSVSLRGTYFGLSGPWVLSQADGGFVLKDIPPGTYTVHASKSRGEQGVLEGEAQGARPDGPEVTVRLEVKPGIVLRLFSAKHPTERVATDGLGYTCRRTPEGSTGIGGTRTSAPRTWFRLDRDPGVWYVTVQVDGYESVDFGKVILPEDRDLVLDVYLSKTE